MKKGIALVLALMAGIMMTGCGDTEYVIENCESKKYSIDDMQDAVKEISDYCDKKNYDLLDISYSGYLQGNEAMLQEINNENAVHDFDECIFFTGNISSPKNQLKSLIDGQGLSRKKEKYFYFSLGRKDGGEWELVDGDVS